MSKKKNLERAIVLGLILSTGICGSAWAEKTIHDFKGDRDSNGTITLTNGTVVTVVGTGNYGPGIDHNTGGSDIDYDNNPNAIYLNNSLFYQDKEGIHNLPVLAEDNVKLVFNNVNMVSPYIKKAAGATNGADIEINNGIGNGNTVFAGISISAIIEANSLKITSSGRGMYIGDGDNHFPTKDEYGNDFYDVDIDVIKRFELNSASDAIFNEGVGPSNVIIEAGDVYIVNTDRNGLYNATQEDIVDQKNTISITADDNITILSQSKKSDQATIKNITEGKTELHAGGRINLEGDKNGIWATKGLVSLNSQLGNSISAKVVKEYKFENNKDITVAEQGFSVYAEGGSKVDLSVTENETGVIKGDNVLAGAVYASGIAKTEDGQKAINVKLNSKTNDVSSYTAIADAGDINTIDQVIKDPVSDKEEQNKFFGKRFISALYAEDGANIELTGENKIGTWADNNDANTLERTVWAYSSDDKIGSSISFDGAVQIGTDSYSSSPNSADVAIAAGTATGLIESNVIGFNGERSTVTVKYDNFSDGNRSSISGDILSAYAGKVDISTDNSKAGINITGNLLAGNNGILSVDIGQGGVLTGRADDYGDAGYVENGRVGVDSEGNLKTFYNPAFSSTIYSGGNVGLEMGAGSRWNVTGQSWITSIDTSDANGNTQDTRATIDLVNYYKDETGENNTNAHALTVYDFNGDADFIMNLDGNRANSDMLYMKKAVGTYRINLAEAVTSEEINSDHEGNAFSGLRFATVGNNESKANFLVGSYDTGGAFNVEYTVGTDKYGGTETRDENDVYNGSSLDGGKPGSDMVDGFFGSNGTPVDDKNNQGGVSTMDLKPENSIMQLDEEVGTLEETGADKYNATNHKIIGIASKEINDTGKTILNMSRANYSNAIYMDRLNKRMGEARYINSEEDEGMWVRIRHDRIGKDDAYRSQNTMYELGYDQKQECDNGERRVGMAIDYMHGDTGYDQIAGKGEIDRYGLWLYDTWMGDKGHYADYVAKWGHLSNDFEVYTMQNGDKVTGDYSNNVFSVSAEYGRKKDIGNDWYFEPQVQAQLARVTGADYTTNQGTKVSVDGINSLIGRAGFRLGKDFGEEKQSTVYIKADVLHEFLGDQDVRVLDKSSDNKWAGISYENEGTWYDVGFGFATQMSKNSYAFMDFEKSFGNDNDETYQINVGMQWSF